MKFEKYCKDYVLEYFNEVVRLKKHEKPTPKFPKDSLITKQPIKTNNYCEKATS